MNRDINRYQAQTIADILLFMVVATGLFAMVVYYPSVSRSTKDCMVQKQTFNNKVLPFDLKSLFKK